MEHVDQPKQQDEESLDAVSSASHWSKVSKKKSKSKTHWYWLAGGIVAVILVLFISSDHQTTGEKFNRSLGNNDYSAPLNENLEKLRAMETKKAVVKINAMLKAENTMPTLASQKMSKAYLVRQNAPTSMYANNSVETNGYSSTMSGHTPTETTLADAGPNSRFGNAKVVTTTVEAQTIPHPEYTIASGEFLHAILETAINSDLPGMIRAVVSQPVYSYQGERIIIPAGSRLIGQYTSSVTHGQNRIMVIWNRVVLPSGIAVQLNSPSTDALGRAGQGADALNRHFFARFGQSALLSIIGAGAATIGVGTQNEYNSAAQYRTAIAESFQDSSKEALKTDMRTKPSLHVYQGATLNVFVAHDLSFYRALKHSIELPRHDGATNFYTK